MHVIADQEISKHFARKFKYFFDTTKSSALEVTQFSWVSWTPLIHNSSSLTMTIFMLYTEKEQVKSTKKTRPHEPLNTPQKPASTNINDCSIATF